MIMAVTCLGLLVYIAMEVMYDSTVEYTVNAQALNRLKAYYAAKSGAQLGLLRVKVYQDVMARMSPQQLGAVGDYVDEIWRFPFTWPLVLPEELNAVDKEMAQSATKETLMDASFAVSITDEGSKIDLSDLISSSETLSKTAEKRLLEIFDRRIESDDEWRRKYGNIRPAEIVNNITDWMSDKNSSKNGGDKRAGYAELNRDAPDAYPPNRGFRTLQELRMVTGMNDDFYDLLVPHVTIYGMRGVNPNVVSKDILMSLDRGITSEVADALIQRRNDPQLGPYKSPDDFWGYASQKGARLESADAERPPLIFDALSTFRIKSTGEYAGAVREVELIVADINRIATNIQNTIDKEKKADPGGASPAAPTGPAAPTSGSNSSSKGPPRIVYWTER